MSFFLRNAVGFLIQLYPCVLLCYAPFPEESFRFPRRAVLAGATMCSLAVSLLFPRVLLYSGRIFEPLAEDNYNVSGNLLFLLTAIGAVAAYLWLIREKAIKKLLVLVIVEFYATTQFWLVNLFLPFIPYGMNGYVYSVAAVLMYVLTMAVLLPVVVLVVMRPMAKFLRETDAGEMTREFRTVIFMTNATLVVMVISDTSVGYSNLAERSVLLCPLALLLIAGECMIYRLLFLKTIQMREEARQQRAIEIQRLQYEKITREIDHISRPI